MQSDTSFKLAAVASTDGREATVVRRSGLFHRQLSTVRKSVLIMVALGGMVGSTFMTNDKPILAIIDVAIQDTPALDHGSQNHDQKDRRHLLMKASKSAFT